jgi:hypothetical protein
MSRNAQLKKLNETAPTRPQPYELWRTPPVCRREVECHIGLCMTHGEVWKEQWDAGAASSRNGLSVMRSPAAQRLDKPKRAS